MKLTEDKFPILSCIKKNFLTDKFREFVENQVPEKVSQENIIEGTRYFKDRYLQMNYISKSIHEKLSDTSNFIKAKELLKNSPKVTGLLLLPETIYPDFTNVPDYVDVNSNDYPINAILYSWLSWNDYDKMDDNLDDEDDEEYNSNRELFIIPIYNDGTTVGSKNSLEMMNNNEIYGKEYSEAEGRSWYGKIHDYVMSFILFYNYTETDTKILNGIDSGKQRRAKLNDEKYLNTSENEIEIVDSSYFTKIIRAGEFGVSGHFRLQRYGIGNSETKIIFIDNYKKTGYTRGAKIERKNGG